MKTGVMLFLIALLAGCAGSFGGTHPDTCTVTVPYAQPIAYTHASQVFRQRGGQITGTDGRQAFSGVERGAQVINVQLDPQGATTLVTVTGNITPGKIMLETLPSVQTFCSTLQALEAGNAH
jgi:hypothetical protein